MTHKILFVDDDTLLLDAFRRNLRKRFDVSTATSGREGLETISREGPFAVVISDLRMTGMDGFEFLSQVHAVAPESICIILTGHADLDISLRAFNEGVLFRFLTKPCKPHILIDAINSAIEEYTRNLKVAPSEERETETPAMKKKVLIVDDDPDTLYRLADVLKACEMIDVLTADNGNIAMELLGTIKIDLVIADRQMPQMDGLQLLSHMRKKYAEIPFILLTWCMTRELENRIHTMGVTGYFEKPVDANALTQTIVDEIYAGPIGIIDGISTGAFAQMIETEEKTCTLKIKAPEHLGMMYFLKGRLINAETGNHRGEKAAFEILNWNNTAIEIENYCRKTERKIKRPLMQVLIEAAKLKDETRT